MQWPASLTFCAGEQKEGAGQAPAVGRTRGERKETTRVATRALMSVAETPARWRSSMQTNDCGSCSSACEGRRWGPGASKNTAVRGGKKEVARRCSGDEGTRDGVRVARARDAPRASEVRKRRAGFGGKGHDGDRTCSSAFLPEPPPARGEGGGRRRRRRGLRLGLRPLRLRVVASCSDASISAVSMASFGGV